MLTAHEASEYLSALVNEYPGIREVWLFGSRANHSAKAGSDWDYMAFADEATYAALERNPRFNREGVDLMVVTDDQQFSKPWDDQRGRKSGTLATGFGGLHWQRLSATEATYRATKAPEANGWNVRVFTQRAVRVYP